MAGGAVRAVVEAAGIKDILSKVLGTNNQASNVYATIEALSKLRPVKPKKIKEEVRVLEQEAPKEVKSVKSPKTKVAVKKKVVSNEVK